MAICRYTIDGFLVCDPPTTSLEHFSLSDFGQVCPPGSYSQKCKAMTCKNGVMQGYCQQTNMALKEVSKFDGKSCDGKDIYFDTSKNNLSCE